MSALIAQPEGILKRLRIQHGLQQKEIVTAIEQLAGWFSDETTCPQDRSLEALFPVV